LRPSNMTPTTSKPPAGSVGGSLSNPAIARYTLLEELRLFRL
jgi:hypothetical protein